jgi:hypothetical protein
LAKNVLSLGQFTKQSYKVEFEINLFFASPNFMIQNKVIVGPNKE